ncbi:MAG TPA: RsmE family RNA methyltransferase [Candidatus Portnoybacteria bacterium]|nr:RsmE family RNA methyltransferase [Candidatus Portnoybacteria bacterium]
MRQNRFFGDFDFGQKSLRISGGDFLHQIKNVLRLGTGEEIILVNGQSQEAIVKIITYGKDFVSAEIQTVRENKNEPERRVILYCSILKRENFELVVQKATEVGVSAIVPVICEHTIKTGLKKERLVKIIKEAVEQSGRGMVPDLSEPISFEQAVKEAQQNDENFFFDPSTSFRVDFDFKKKKTVGLFIGPEGGWGNFEIDLVRQRGFKMVSLGKLTLRGETAAIVASYLACQS